MSENESQDTDPHREAGVKFDRGSDLSIFAGDRREDLTALLFAMLIALGVYFIIG